MYNEEYPPHHIDLSQVQHRANPRPQRKKRRQSRQVREYKRNSRGVYGRGNHNYTLRSMGAKQDASADRVAMVRAALIMATIGTCGLMLPVWLTFEIVTFAIRRTTPEPQQQPRPQRRPVQNDNDQWADPILLMGDD